MTVDGAGNLYVADEFNYRIRKIDSRTAIITTIAGGISDFWGDNGPSFAASLNLPAGLAVDSAGRVYIADTLNNRVRKSGVDGLITTIAGTGESSNVDAPISNGVPATTVPLTLPSGLAVDSQGNLFVALLGNGRVIKLDFQSGLITTLAGTGQESTLAMTIPATMDPPLLRHCLVRGMSQ